MAAANRRAYAPPLAKRSLSFNLCLPCNLWISLCGFLNRLEFPMRAALSLLALVVAAPAFAAEPAKLKVLFLGDNAGHRPADRFKQLQPVFAARGIDMTYT